MSNHSFQITSLTYLLEIRVRNLFCHLICPLFRAQLLAIKTCFMTFPYTKHLKAFKVKHVMIRNQPKWFTENKIVDEKCCFLYKANIIAAEVLSVTHAI